MREGEKERGREIRGGGWGRDLLDHRIWPTKERLVMGMKLSKVVMSNTNTNTDFLSLPPDRAGDSETSECDFQSWRDRGLFWCKGYLTEYLLARFAGCEFYRCKVWRQLGEVSPQHLLLFDMRYFILALQQIYIQDLLAVTRNQSMLHNNINITVRFYS
ncbi:hypothetical protein J6590_042214 [Homalodisca vitripennis]|nr:hypothetical protein J6590_042214 [Homalodisca vitripennis]